MKMILSCTLSFLYGSLRLKEKILQRPGPRSLRLFLDDPVELGMPSGEGDERLEPVAIDEPPGEAAGAYRDLARV